MYNKANPLHFKDESLYLVEGTLTELQTARTTVNLLEQIDNSLRSKSVVAGAAAALGGMHGIVANSAAIALYDGEATHHFAGVLDGKVVCGTFQHADKIQEGDRVRVVVSKRGDVLFAHSIMNADTQEFYMPMNVFSSSDGLFGHCMRVAWRFTILGWFLFLLVGLFSGVFSSTDNPENTFNDKLKLGLLFFALPPLFMFPFELWTYYSLRGDKSEQGSDYGESIFKVFGFPHPEKIDLMRHSELSSGTGGGWYAAWRGDKLLQKLEA